MSGRTRGRGPQGSPTSPGFQLGPGVWTRLRYTVHDAEGEIVEGTPAEVALVFGFGALLPGLEAALEGATAGTRRSVELKARDAYGPRVESAEIEVAREDFPPDVAPGDRFEVEREDGTPAVVRVLAVADEHVLIDLNHPLAGQKVRFDVEVLDARVASADELVLAESALLDPPDEGEEAPDGLISPARLLRPGVRS
jgi:FKBP-type peptidyl-prolyl cis-trans isomerase SlyD